MTSPNTRAGLLSLVGALALALILVLAHRFAPGLYSPDGTTLPVPACNLQREACSVVLPGGTTLGLAFLPRPVAPVRPFRIEAVYSGDGPIEVEFTGVDMDMGRLSVALIRANNGLYQADASLPVCTTGRMAWLATVKLTVNGRRLALPFRFHAPE